MPFRQVVILVISDVFNSTGCELSQQYELEHRGQGMFCMLNPYYELPSETSTELRERR